MPSPSYRQFSYSRDLEIIQPNLILDKILLFSFSFQNPVEMIDHSECDTDTKQVANYTNGLEMILKIDFNFQRNLKSKSEQQQHATVFFHLFFFLQCLNVQTMRILFILSGSDIGQIDRYSIINFNSVVDSSVHLLRYLEQKFIAETNYYNQSQFHASNTTHQKKNPENYR